MMAAIHELVPMQQSWYQNAIFYALDVETFYDSKNDGIGDLQGLIEKLDYIANLGATCLWLLPFYPSPNRDNGFDVMDYYNVDQRLGTLDDFVKMLKKAAQLGIRVVIDLVVNHTSHEHPWFQEARKDRSSPFREFYVWSDHPLEYEKDHLMLQGEENTIWTYDEEAGQYYLHRFYKEQPDLNIVNKKVQQEILKIMSFWLRLGVSGFRIDAASMLVEPYGLKGADRDDLFHFINEMRDFGESIRPDVLLLAEVNAAPKEMEVFFSNNERMNMVFNFFINQHLFLSVTTGNKHHLEDALRELPQLHEKNQWLQFLRQHDELNLKLLSQQEQQILLEKLAPDPEMRIYGFGIRRRLAPIANGNLKLIRLLYSLMFSLPGCPLIRYGDEIGMGEDLSLPGRSSVRTPMQWSSEKNGGFSSAPAEQLVHPVISGGEFGYEKINVETARQQPGSLLNWIGQLIRIRKQCPEISF